MNSNLLRLHHHSDNNDLFGFWLYILTDCILFAAIFATYAVLYKNTNGNPSIGQLTSLPYVFGETLALLSSSLTYGLVILASYKNKLRLVLLWLIATFILGSIFIGMELHEFISLCHEGYSWVDCAAYSAFFTLVGTHGLHVSIGLGWMCLLAVQLLTFGLNATMVRRLNYLALFWAFLDIIWIFVFTIVYLMGAL